MREIKLRVFDDKDKEFVDEFLISNDGELFKILAFGDIAMIRKSQFIIEQYTGLKDKNGKEIYEGDIVKIKHINCFYDCSNCNAFVEYTDCNFRLRNKKKGVYNIWLGSNDISYVEIIGNIHENPELLENE